MDKLIKERIEKLYEDFTKLTTISRAKNEEVKKYKKDFSDKLTIEENIKNFSNIVADFNLITRDSQVVFSELFNTIKLYKDLNLSDLSEEIIEFYNKNEPYYPKTLFVVKDEGIVEKEEGLLEAERSKFLESEYLKNLINSKD